MAGQRQQLDLALGQPRNEGRLVGASPGEGLGAGSLPPAICTRL